jgi:KDO2-lipid IV(A) lauroyltransferase
VTPGETPRESIAFHAYRSVAALARALPEAQGRRLFRLAGRVACRLAPRMRSVVAHNQAQVLGRAPEDPIVRAATRQAFESYARYWFDSFRFPVTPSEDVAARFEAVGADHLWRALQEGRGAIVALPHVGNWDAAGPWLRSMDRPIVAVAEQLRPARLYDLFVANRSAGGVEIIGLGDDGIGRRLTAKLSEGYIVALVADRDLTGRGVEATMFGRVRRLPAGPAQLSISTGAPLLVTPVYQVAGGWRCVMSPPLEIERSGDRRADAAALTRRMGEEFERAIAAAPADWHMFQPAWED